MTRPPSVIGQLDGTVVDDLPSLPYGLEEDDLMIEWDAIVDSNSAIDVAPPAETDTAPATDEVLADDVLAESDDVSVDDIDPDVAVFELSLDLAEFVDDVEEPSIATDALIDETAEIVDAIEADEVELPDFELAYVDFDDSSTPDVEMSESPVPGETVEDLEVRDESGDFEFSVVWPDGSEEPADIAVVDFDETIDAEPTFTETDDGELHFTMPPLALSDEAEAADADVPDDVADAVRRAIAAIESASVGDPDELAVTEPAVTEPAVAEVAEVEFVEIEITETHRVRRDGRRRSGAGGAFATFAPPTMATRAEVLYGQMSDDGSSIDAQSSSLAPTIGELAPSTGTVSVDGHVDNDDSASGDRASALRRLIGSLRRKDH